MKSWHKPFFVLKNTAELLFCLVNCLQWKITCFWFHIVSQMALWLVRSYVDIFRRELPKMLSFSLLLSIFFYVEVCSEDQLFFLPPNWLLLLAVIQNQLPYLQTRKCWIVRLWLFVWSLSLYLGPFFRLKAHHSPCKRKQKNYFAGYIPKINCLIS